MTNIELLLIETSYWWCQSN